MDVPEKPPEHVAQGHYQVPKALLYSRDHSALAVAAWCMYEALEVPDLLGGRDPARARRCWVADHLGVSEPTLDRARTQLLESGPWLARKVRGRKRAALHKTLGRPQQTGEPYARVPAWTLDRVNAAADRPDGCVTPDAWRLYAVLCDRLDEQGSDVTIARIAEWAGCSTSTARRRLHELETVGWVVVGRSSGQWMRVCVVSAHYQLAVEDPFQIRGVTPSKSEESPLPNLRSPLETPSERSPSEETHQPLAVGELPRRRRASAEPADAERKITPSTGPRPLGGPSVMTALPVAWLSAMRDDERERVLAAIEAEMATGRTVAEMTARVHRRLTHWAGRQVRRPVAAALTVVRRGYDCPRPDCEDHLLPSGHECGACAEIGASVLRERQESVATAEASLSEEPPQVVGSSGPPPAGEVAARSAVGSGPNEEFRAARERMRRRRSA